jgi:hypothetical protein
VKSLKQIASGTRFIYTRTFFLCAVVGLNSSKTIKQIKRLPAEGVHLRMISLATLLFADDP